MDSRRTIYITGASTGIGAATARAAVAQGWAVVGLARSKARLGALADELGDAFLAVAGDVAAQADQARAVEAGIERFGRLDAAFANAGLGASVPGTEAGDPENWRQMIDVNIWGALLTAKVALPALRGRRGHFLVTGSRAGRVSLKGSVYGATKWFVHGWAANLAEEMREWGGRCTVIAPGMVDTPFFDSPRPEGLRAEDVARAVLYALEQPPGMAVGEVTLMPNPAGAQETP
ncbi:SDR family oxidoreductase [Halovulum dunhuangense]|uniref:SDR family oxidoreductase n=1 Tax=Halovulum dunhuangense TaxID=1505036 RepID=A0A849L5Q6_9RHOB|nr:SDR family oxidoreductase [Halovulum dunhuangense]NNU81512.1 SDR family oxidoreductase [Halovulum dunhuangense]